MVSRSPMGRRTPTQKYRNCETSSYGRKEWSGVHRSGTVQWSQSFNAVNQLRILGRWMRLITIPNQSSVAKAFLEFDERGRMTHSPYYDRIVDVMEELVKFTLLTRDRADHLVDRYSERKESPAKLSERVNQKKI